MLTEMPSKCGVTGRTELDVWLATKTENENPKEARP